MAAMGNLWAKISIGSASCTLYTRNQTYDYPVVKLAAIGLMEAPSRPADLPEFERPPINEVVLSLQFAPITGLNNALMGAFWSRVRQRLPIISEQPPIDPAFETFGGLPVAAPPLRFETFATPPTSRFWLESRIGTELLQVQRDRIIRNWRKREACDEYPRYETIRAQLRVDLADFTTFLTEEGIDPPQFNQCELTYINLIELPDGEDPHTHMERVTNAWSGNIRLPGGDLESAGFQLRYVLRESDAPFGRAHVNFSPVYQTSDMAPLIRMEICVRGRPDGDDPESAFAFLDRGRDTVVRTFAALTTSALHQYWGCKDG